MSYPMWSPNKDGVLVKQEDGNTLYIDADKYEGDTPSDWQDMDEGVAWVYTEETAREERDSKLADSDWTQVSDSPVDKEAWAVYRQALRDIPQQEGFPENISWPVAPE